MSVSSIPREIYERDPAEYLAAFDEYLLAFEATEDEHALAHWLTVNAVETDDESVFRFIALGNVAASWERWSAELGQQRLGLFENMRRKEARKYAERGIPEEMFDAIYGSYVLSARIGNEAEAGDRTILDRLTLIFDEVVLANTEFESPSNEDTLRGLRSLFDLGVGSNLFLRWRQAMDDQGVPDSERWDDIALAPVYDDRLADLDLPVAIRGCTLDTTDTLGYEIRSPGKLGGFHLTTFLAEDERANILNFVTSGRLGTREVRMPEPAHVDVLRELGFKEAVFPDGNRYRLSSWGGLSGIRRIKE